MDGWDGVLTRSGNRRLIRVFVSVVVVVVSRVDGALDG